MTAATLLPWVLGLLALERGVELLVDARHRRRLAARGAVVHGRDGFAFILFAQLLLFALPAAEVTWAPWSGLGPWSYVGVVALLAAQGLRYWVVRTLGDRWTLRVVTVPGAPRIQTGPYRFLSHPNYVAVMAEAVAVPLVFGAWAALVIVPIVQGSALWRRVRAEDAALEAAARTGRAALQKPAHDRP